MDEIVSNVLRWAVPFVLGGAVGIYGVKGGSGDGVLGAREQIQCSSHLQFLKELEKQVII